MKWTFGLLTVGNAIGAGLCAHMGALADAMFSSFVLGACLVIWLIEVIDGQAARP